MEHTLDHSGVVKLCSLNKDCIVFSCVDQYATVKNYSTITLQILEGSYWMEKTFVLGFNSTKNNIAGPYGIGLKSQ